MQIANQCTNSILDAKGGINPCKFIVLIVDAKGAKIRANFNIKRGSPRTKCSTLLPSRMLPMEGLTLLHVVVEIL